MTDIGADAEPPCLSAETQKALEEFYKDQEAFKNQDEGTELENWQLSQFWYSDETAQVLAEAALLVAGSTGRIACVSCPTVYKKLLTIKPSEVQCLLLEYDKRFSIYGEDFIDYDFNYPLNLKEELRGTCDIVLADPPFLSRECLEKTAQTVKFLVKEKIILCTGSIMEETAREVLGVTPAEFKPKHARNLANEFLCYSNYKFFNHLSNKQ